MTTASNRRYAERHKKLGLCTRCNNKAVKNRVLCKNCLRLSNKRGKVSQKKRYSFYKKVKAKKD